MKPIGTKGKPKYWIEVQTRLGMSAWYIKAINGRRKCISGLYKKPSYCINDAKALANYTGIEVRIK